MKLVETSWNIEDVRGTFLRDRVRIQNDLSIEKLSVLKKVLFRCINLGYWVRGWRLVKSMVNHYIFGAYFEHLTINLVQRGDSSYAGLAMLSGWMKTLLLWKYSVQYQPLEVVVEKDLRFVVDKDLATFGPGLKRWNDWRAVVKSAIIAKAMPAQVKKKNKKTVNNWTGK